MRQFSGLKRVLFQCLKIRHLLALLILIAFCISPISTASAAGGGLGQPGSPHPIPKFTPRQLEAMHSVFLDYYVNLLDMVEDTNDFSNIFLSHLSPTDREDAKKMLSGMDEPPLVRREGNDLVFIKGNDSIRMEWTDFTQPKVKINGMEWLIDSKRSLKWQLGLLKRKLEYSNKPKSESLLQKFFMNDADAEGLGGIVVTYGLSAFQSVETAAAREAAQASSKVFQDAVQTEAKKIVADEVKKALAQQTADAVNSQAVKDAAAEAAERKVARKELTKTIVYTTGLGLVVNTAFKPVSDGVGTVSAGVRQFSCLQAYDNGYDPNGWIMMACSGIAPPDDPDSVVGNSYSDLAAQSEKSKSVLGLFMNPDELQCPKLHAAVYRARMRDVATSPNGEPLPADKNTNPFFYVRVNYLDEKKGVMDSVCIQKDHEDPKCPEDDNLLYYIKIRGDKKIGYMTIPEEVSDNQKKVASNPGDPKSASVDDVVNSKLNALKTSSPRQTDNKDQTSEPKKLRYVPVKPNNKMTTDEELAYHKGLDILHFINVHVMNCKAKEAAEATEEGRKVPSPDSAPNSPPNAVPAAALQPAVK